MNPGAPLFENRRDAGIQLAAVLRHLKKRNPVILALPRGGVPVAYEIAHALQAPLDIILVRKIGAPDAPELGLGAVVNGQPPQRVLNTELISQLQVPASYLEAEESRQLAEIARRRAYYCGGHQPVSIAGRVVIVVDDGIATGGTMAAALKALAQTAAARILLAVPVAPPGVVDSLRAFADDAVCLHTPADFRAVGQFYRDFAQTGDDEVIALLRQADQEASAHASRQ